MAFKIVVVCALLAYANAGYLSPATTYTSPLHKVAYANPAVDAIASTQQNVVRSFGGTVSTYSKSVDTPYSSVHKSDTRINNNVYTPTVAKSVVYPAPSFTKTYIAQAPAPVVEKSFAYAAPSPVYAKAVTYQAPAQLYAKSVAYQSPPQVYAKPVAYTVQAAPAIAKAVYSAQPVTYAHASPAVVSHVAPVAKTVTYSAPLSATNVNHGSQSTTYTHNAPGVTGYGSSQTIHYSPAEMVSHMSFDGFGTHWGF